MTITGPDARPGDPGQAVVDAAMLVLERVGLTPADLLAAPAARPPAPTFAEYIPVVSALVSDGCRRAYGSYWNRVTDQWGSRRIDEPTPSEIRQLVRHVRANVVPRRNSRGGRSAAEHLIAALRCMYKHAEEDGLINPADNPARKVDKPRRLPSTRRAVADKRLAEINHAAATLDHAGVLGVVGHERFGVAGFPRLVQAREHVENGLPVGVGPCRGGLAGHRSPRFSPRGGERHPWEGRTGPPTASGGPARDSRQDVRL